MSEINITHKNAIKQGAEVSLESIKDPKGASSINVSGAVEDKTSSSIINVSGAVEGKTSSSIIVESLKDAKAGIEIQEFEAPGKIKDS